MTNLSTFALVLLAAAGPGGKAKPSPAAALARKQIEQAMLVLDKATIARSIAQTMAMLDKKFVGHEPGGVTTNYAAIELRLKQEYKLITKVSTSTARITSFAFHGNTVVTTIAQSETGTLNVPAGSPRFKAGPQPYKDVSTDRITWVKRGKSWKVLVDTQLTDTTTVSGKKVS
ncbi:MAG: hypothetical protein KGJ62_08540 [Armatimonadetes bacterium]|nr:hypothetical protein [Armatimonadota bacterium]MDE2205060.1 hypothetical protein [Armatimonadota bacterium]